MLLVLLSCRMQVVGAANVLGCLGLYKLMDLGFAQFLS